MVANVDELCARRGMTVRHAYVHGAVASKACDDLLTVELRIVKGSGHRVRLTLSISGGAKRRPLACCC
jgi:hypothetical protein